MACFFIPLLFPKTKLFLISKPVLHNWKRHSAFISVHGKLVFSPARNYQQTISLIASLEKGAWIAFMEKEKLQHGIVTGTLVSTKGQSVLQVMVCPTLSSTIEEKKISRDSVVDYCSLEAGISRCSNILLSKDTVTDMLMDIAKKVQYILSHIWVEKIEEMWRVFSKLNAQACYATQVFCEYLFSGKKDIAHWMATGLILKSMEGCFQRGPIGQGWLVESVSSRRNKSLMQWKQTWNSLPCSDSSYQRGLYFSYFMPMDAVDYIYHLEECLYRCRMDKKAKTIMRAIGIEESIQGILTFLRSCGANIPMKVLNDGQFTVDHDNHQTQWIEEMEQLEKNIVNRRKALKCMNQHVMHSYCLDTKGSVALDDAISIERIDAHYFIIGVHVIEIASYISQDSWIDKEARKRQETLYLKENSIHMLPPRLLQLLSFSIGKHSTHLVTIAEERIEWCNETLAVRFHVDNKNKTLLKQPEIERMIIPPVCRKLTWNEPILPQDGQVYEDLQQMMQTISLWKDRNGMTRPYENDKRHRNAQVLGREDLQWLLDKLLTAASVVFQQHLSPGHEKHQNNTKRRLGTSPLRKYEDLMLQRRLLATWEPSYVDSKKWWKVDHSFDWPSYLKTSRRLERLFKQILFQRRLFFSSTDSIVLYYQTPLASLTLKTSSLLKMNYFGVWLSIEVAQSHVEEVETLLAQPLVKITIEEIHLFRKRYKAYLK